MPPPKIMKINFIWVRQSTGSQWKWCYSNVFTIKKIQWKACRSCFQNFFGFWMYVLSQFCNFEVKFLPKEEVCRELLWKTAEKQEKQIEQNICSIFPIFLFPGIKIFEMHFVWILTRAANWHNHTGLSTVKQIFLFSNSHLKRLQRQRRYTLRDNNWQKLHHNFSPSAVPRQRNHFFQQ